MGFVLGSGGIPEHIPRNRHVLARRVRGFAADKSWRGRSTEGCTVAWRRRGGCSAGLALGNAIPGHQENLDVFLCARGGRLQRDAAGFVLPRGGCLEETQLVSAVRLDWDEF